MKKIIFTTLTLVSFSTSTFAGGDLTPISEEENTAIEVGIDSNINNFYLGLGTALVTAREAGQTLSFTEGSTGQDRIGNATFITGYKFNEKLAIEARATISVFSMDIAEMTGASLFLKPQYPLTDKFTMYGLVGYGIVNISEHDGANIDVSKAGFQWGAGASYEVYENVDLFADYTSLAHNMEGTFLTKDSAHTDAITLGVTYRF